MERFSWRCAFCNFAQAVILVLDNNQEERCMTMGWSGIGGGVVSAISVHMGTKPATHVLTWLVIVVTPFLLAAPGIAATPKSKENSLPLLFPGKCHWGDWRVNGGAVETDE